MDVTSPSDTESEVISFRSGAVKKCGLYFIIIGVHSFSTGDFKSSLFLLCFLATSLSFSKAMELHREANKPEEFPEGGLKANLTVLGAFMAFACTFGQMSAFGTYQAWYTSHQLQHLSASKISLIGSLQFWVFFFSVRFNFVFISY